MPKKTYLQYITSELYLLAPASPCSGSYSVRRDAVRDAAPDWEVPERAWNGIALCLQLPDPDDACSCCGYRRPRRLHRHGHPEGLPRGRAGADRYSGHPPRRVSDRADGSNAHGWAPARGAALARACSRETGLVHGPLRWARQGLRTARCQHSVGRGRVASSCLLRSQSRASSRRSGEKLSDSQLLAIAHRVRCVASIPTL